MTSAWPLAQPALLFAHLEFVLRESNRVFEVMSAGAAGVYEIMTLLRLMTSGRQESMGFDGNFDLEANCDLAFRRSHSCRQCHSNWTGQSTDGSKGIC
jgi:hypothetical protein